MVTVAKTTHGNITVLARKENMFCYTRIKIRHQDYQ